MTEIGDAGLTQLPDRDSAAALLTAFERDLDPTAPERSGARMLAYGELSATMILPDALFAGIVAKRMTGFPDDAAVAGYVRLVDDYCRDLRDSGVQVVDTAVIPVPRRRRAQAVYLLQPQLPADRLGNTLLQNVDDERLEGMVSLALHAVDAALQGGDAHTHMAVDGQLSNWWFGNGPAKAPVLLDVGTPFVRLDGVYLMHPRILLAAIPPGLRSWYLWRRAGEKYLDDYFDRRLVGLDLLGNFIKEGARGRIPAGLSAVNAWLGADGPVTTDEVHKYYADDAATLELFLRVRRGDRWLRRKVLRRHYDFVLPGSVDRG